MAPYTFIYFFSCPEDIIICETKNLALPANSPPNKLYQWFCFMPAMYTSDDGTTEGKVHETVVSFPLSFVSSDKTSRTFKEGVLTFTDDGAVFKGQLGDLNLKTDELNLEGRQFKESIDHLIKSQLNMNAE